MAKGRTAGVKEIFKRNAVVAAIVLFVCAAVYLNWSYQKDGDVNAGAGSGTGTNSGKTLGDAAMVGAQDPLLGGSKAAGTGDKSQGGALQDGAGPGDVEPGQGTAQVSSYFANARLNRQQARDSALSLLQESAAGEDADQAVKDQVGAAIQTMAQSTVTEAQIENLVVAKGYADCVAFIGESRVSVVVETADGSLTDVDTARITDIVTEATGFPASKITIIGVD